MPLPMLDKLKEKLRFEILEKERIWLLDEELEKRWKALAKKELGFLESQ